ncbi:unnamed protein product [Rangifer tarandus platyrhynchus]|uniref:Uncharacterized protein n=1 Tax=Rangifer tarandus platyrhynchus TaxID=3082113 RepID=A0AC59ZB15_RANTA
MSDYVICQNPPAAHSRQGTQPGPQDVLVGGCCRPSVLSPPLSPSHLPQRPACSWLLLKPATTLLPQGLCTGSSPRLGCSFLSFFKGCCLLSITDWHLLRARDFLVAQAVKRLPAVRENRVQSLGQEDPLEKEVATHSSTLA